MRLATIATRGGTHAAVVRDGTCVPLPDYADVGALLRAGEDGLAAARDAAAREPGRPFEADRVRRPVLEPGAVVCAGLNYRAHIEEMGRALPEHPTLFAKLPRALLDPYADIPLPGATTDYEGELAVVIGRGGRDVPRERAWDHVAGATVLNDVTVRALQRRTNQWFAGKQAPTPMGPVLVTTDELGDLDRWELRVTVNGELRQRTLLGDMVFDVPALVSDLSRLVELRPGDVIATGTPGGVGDADGRYLRTGDVVEVAIDGIGSIRNAVR